VIRPVGADGRIETGGAFTPIDRPRIVDRIASAATQRIVLIIAPAGYGKSIALRQYLTEIGEPHIRFDVRPEHANLLGFVRGFAEAFLDEAPDARKTLSVAFEKSSSARNPGVELASWMHAHIKTYLGLIAIDDLHLAEEDPEISKFLVSLIERTKGRARWVIASRSSLDLPVGSWLAYGDMDITVDEQDLRFTIDEARQTAKASRVGVREEELSDILDMTEGWPTALSFALRSSTRSIDLRNIAASTREMVYRYLAEQVYESLEPDERDLLHFIGYLPEISLDVLRRAGYTRAKGTIEKLRDRVAFIYPERPGLYRCHDLFRDFLQHAVELEGDAAAAQIQKRVGAALEQSGNLPFALRLYIDMRSQSDVLRILQSDGFALMEGAHGDVVGAALEILSDERRATSAVALGLRAQREADAGRFDRAESLFERAVSLEGDAAFKAEFAIRLSTMLFNQGRPVAPLLEPISNDESLPIELRAKATSFLAPAYARTHDRAQAEAAMARAEEFARTCDSEQVRARLYHRSGIAALDLEYPSEQVARLFERAQALAAECGLYSTSAAAFGGLANVAMLYHDDAAKGIWYAQQAMNAALKAGDRFSLQLALLQGIEIEARRGNVERVIALEKQFVDAVTTDAKRSAWILTVKAMAAAWRGDFGEALRFVSMAPTNTFYSFDRALHGSLEALYAIGAGKRDLALAASARVQSEAAGTDFPYPYGKSVAEIAIQLCAITEALAGRLTAAQRVLLQQKCSDSPASEAMKHLATAVCRVVKNPALEADVTEAAGELNAVGWGGVGMIVEAVCTQVSDQRPAEDSPLTKAELDVLTALARGHSPKLIAQETGRSVYTIQAHIQNVIKKLGCSGRAEALTVARKKGLLKFN
jgi:ATP/maltotriose-dependent transcriptional regulator MalT